MQPQPDPARPMSPVLVWSESLTTTSVCGGQRSTHTTISSSIQCTIQCGSAVSEVLPPGCGRGVRNRGVRDCSGTATPPKPPFNNKHTSSAPSHRAGIYIHTYYNIYSGIYTISKPGAFSNCSRLALTARCLLIAPHPRVVVPSRCHILSYTVLYYSLLAVQRVIMSDTQQNSLECEAPLLLLITLYMVYASLVYADMAVAVPCGWMEEYVCVCLCACVCVCIYHSKQWCDCYITSS